LRVEKVGGINVAIAIQNRNKHAFKIFQFPIQNLSKSVFIKLQYNFKCGIQPVERENGLFLQVVLHFNQFQHL